MSEWSPKEAIAMERRHVLEGEKKIARQLALVAKVEGRGNDQFAKRAVELLGLLHDILELSRVRLLQLEDQFGEEASN